MNVIAELKEEDADDKKPEAPPEVKVEKMDESGDSKPDVKSEQIKTEVSSRFPSQKQHTTKLETNLAKVTCVSQSPRQHTPQITMH